jgi:histone-lysine N-methyltransferase MLL5
MGIDRSNIPDEYMCERCQPRHVDRQHARTLQLRKREELLNTDSSSDTSSSADTDGGKCIKLYWNIQIFILFFYFFA